MSQVRVRPFRRADREQLTALVNAHVQAVVPGISVSVNTVLAAGRADLCLLDPRAYRGG